MCCSNPEVKTFQSNPVWHIPSQFKPKGWCDTVEGYPRYTTAEHLLAPFPQILRRNLSLCWLLRTSPRCWFYGFGLLHNDSSLNR